jgi:autotransporter-associated beta strand protein
MTRSHHWTRGSTRHALVAIVGCLAGVMAQPARAGEITCLPSMDNTLFEYVYDPADPVPPASSGAGPWFAAGRTKSGQLQRALLQFDLSSIPATATIVSAALDLYVVGVPNIDIQNNVAQRPFWLTALLGTGEPAWGEGGSNAGMGSGTGQGAPAQTGDATWLHKLYDSVPWPTGRQGAVGPAPLDPASLGTPAGVVPMIPDPVPTPPFPVTWSNSQMAVDIQAWVRASMPNDGWVVVGDESAPGSKRQFASREYVDLLEGEDYRPKLTVQYTMPVGPPTLIWHGAGSDSHWSTAANWSGATPAAEAILQFGTTVGDGNGDTQNDLNAGTRFSGICFAAGAPGYSLQGNEIRLAGPVENLSRNDQEIGLGVELVSGGGTFDDRGKTLSISGPLSGAGPLVKSGPGNLILSGANDYSGGTVVSGGTLLVANAQALPAGQPLTIQGGGSMVLQSGLNASAEAANADVVPEPGTLALLAAAVAGLAVCLQRQTRTPPAQSVP